MGGSFSTQDIYERVVEGIGFVSEMKCNEKERGESTEKSASLLRNSFCIGKKCI